MKLKDFKISEDLAYLLGVIGGDGTLHKTLSVFVDVYGKAKLPKIAFLRGGTMNNVANTIGIRGTPEKILSNMIVKYHRSEPFTETKLNLVKVNHSYGFLFGMVAVTNFIKHYESIPGEPTPFRAAYLLLYYLWLAVIKGNAVEEIFEPIEGKIFADGKELSFSEYTMIFGGTVENLCFQCRPLHQARRLEDAFQMVAASCTPRELLRLVPRTFFMKPMQSEKVENVIAKEVIFQFSEPISYMVDGDFPEPPTKTITISMGPRLTCIVS